MAAEPRVPHVALSEARLAGRRVTGRGLGQVLTSAPVLAAALLAVILLAIGPLQELDLFLARRWLYRWEPAALPFAQSVLDRLAGQTVCLPVLVTVAAVLARRRRSWRPLVIAGIAEACFALGVGAMKVFFARGVTYHRDPSFFTAGLLEEGTTGISFPSGHAAEAVLIYGTVVYLIAHYSGASERTVRILRRAVVVLVTVSVATSFLIGWHWMTDLLGGVLAGGLFLRLLVDGDIRRRRRAEEAAPRAEPSS